MTIRVAYPMRVDALDKPGGDVLQVGSYIEAGRKIGKDGHCLFDGTLICGCTADLSGFDVIHLTNIDRPVDTYASFRSAVGAGKPTLLSPIHHSNTEIERYEREGRYGIFRLISGFLDFEQRESLRSVVRSLRYPELLSPTSGMIWPGMRSSQRAVLAGVDRILVLTRKEKNDILRDFGPLSEEKFALIPNGFKHETCDQEGTETRDLDVCVVGRIEARKNQVAILRVLERLGISGVFVGKENPNHRSYCRIFKDMIARSASRHFAGLSHDETLRIMQRSRVHVSASWSEVSSLVDLEAFHAGCRVVSSQCGGTQEILGDRAEYVDPGSDTSIREALTRALDRSKYDKPSRPNGESAISVGWDEVAKRLAYLYRDVVERWSTSRTFAAIT